MRQLVRSPKWYLLAAALALAGTALKFDQWYFSRPLWVDEEMVLLNIRDRALAELVGPLWLNQTAPLGWLALQRAVVITFGTSDRAVRALPVLFGIATLWAALWMGKRWMKPPAAALFVLLCATAQWMTYYALEVKPYSADAFWALALPALAIWASEPKGEQPLTLMRTGSWWSVAALAQWFSFGAIFVTPACGLVLCAAALWRSGRRLAVMVALQGLIWLVCFAAHYALSISYASNDEFLRNYWSWGFPPVGAGLTGTLQWLAQQLKPLAFHPGGTTLWAAFWLAVAYGAAVSFGRQPAVGLVILSVTLSAFVLAAFRRVPLTDRLALWMFPVLYAAVALAVDDVIERGRTGFLRRKWANVAAAVMFAGIVGLVSVDIVRRGRDDLIVGGDNHGLDDRSAMRFLMSQRQPGDVLLTTHFGLPAVWWYGDILISDPNRGSTDPKDGTLAFELTYIDRGAPGCRNRRSASRLAPVLAGRNRAAVHLGFASRIPPGFQELVLDELSTLGTLVSYRPIASEGVVAIFDLRLPPQSWTVNVTRPTGQQIEYVKRPAGCLGIRRARRWQ